MEMRLEDTKTEISCRAAKGVIMFLRREHGPDTLAKVFDRAELSIDHVNEGTNWLSFDAFNRLLEALVEVSGDEEAPYKAGTQTADPSTFGPVRVMGTRFLSIHGVYRMMAMHSRYFVKVCDWALLGYSTGHARLEIRYHEGYEQTRYNCDNIRGHLSSIPTWLGAEPAQVSHHTCIMRGADVCIYDVQWEEEPSYTIAIVGALGGVLVGLGGLVVPPALRSASWLWVLLTVLLGVSVAGVCALTARLRFARRQHVEEADALMKATGVIEEFNTELQNKVEARTRELREALANLKASREQALSAERQAAIGVLASGMAHDMNSPLNAIHLTLQAFDEDLPEDDDQLRPLLGSAGRATSRCKRLVADLLAFSREPCLSANTDLQEVVKACVEIFRNESPPDMQVNASFADAPPQLTLDKAQLQQAILNLMSNASDAMGGKGTIDLTVRPADDEVILEIRDNGPGMAPEVSDRVFEPFFTTKATGRGHGLGLPITQQLVQRNGGTIDLDTALGEGTTFLLHFPVSAAAESSRGAES
jgi:signal transduction histidine kinase